MDTSEIDKRSSFVKQDDSFFKFLFEHLDDGIIATSKDGIVLYWNAMATKLYGYSAEEMMGHHIEKLGPGFDMNMFEQRALTGELVSKGEWSKEIDNQLRTFSVVTKILVDDEGKFS